MVKGPNDEISPFNYVVLKDANNNIIWEDYTDSEGTICAYVPKNELLNLRVYDHCKKDFEEIVIDPILEEQTIEYAYSNLNENVIIQGTVYNCQAELVKEGYIMFTQNAIPTYISIQNGQYEFNNYCSGQNSIDAKVVDTETGFYRNYNVDLFQQTLIQQDFNLCGSESEFMLFNIDNSDAKGFSDCKVLQNPDETLIIAKATSEEYFIISVSEFTEGTFPAIVFSSDGVAENGEVMLTIDNYPALDDHMMGSIEGALEGKNISGTFAAKRIK